MFLVATWEDDLYCDTSGTKSIPMYQNPPGSTCTIHAMTTRRTSAKARPNEALIRIALKESDFKDLLDQLEAGGWDHPVRWRIRGRWSEHMQNAEAVKRAGQREGRSAS